MKATKEKKAAINSQVVVESLGKQTDKTFRELSTIKSIRTQEEFNRAAELVKSLKVIATQAKDEQRKITDPIKKALEVIAEHFKPFYNKVEEVEIQIKKSMAVYLEHNKSKLLKLEEDVASGKIKDIGKYVDKAARLTVESDSATVRKVWKAEIQDVQKIPRKFLVPNTQLIVEHLRKGGAPIPGVEWKQVDSIAI
jgi:hypothetical protein